MRIAHHLSSAQFFFENLGYCRFSVFCPPLQERGVLIDMVGQFCVGMFVVISAYDLATKSLPFVGKVLVNGTLLTVVTSLGISLLLKRVMPVPDEEQPAKSNAATTAKKASHVVQTPMDDSLSASNTFSVAPDDPVRRTLISEFEE